MWPISFLASAWAAKQSESKSKRGKRRRHRLLRVESMEPRMPLSATALMLTDSFSGMEETSDDTADTQVLVTEDPVDTVALGTLDTGSDTTCQPLSPDEVPSIEAESDEWLDPFAEEPALQMGPVPSQSDDDGEEESTELASLTLLGGPAPLAPDSSIEADPIILPAPEILWFKVSYGKSGLVHFEGEVEYEFPSQLTIEFGGVLDGWEPIKVASGGIFLLTVPEGDLPASLSGMVTAQAFTPEGIESNLAFTWIL
ncbi:MAG: hypothetical protein EA424_23475 [Planctomycetaceae bacterium]|nr:MAG: hypothetical protein EA424_23475 [Planctomycetaceae bacterium]